MIFDLDFAVMIIISRRQIGSISYGNLVTAFTQVVWLLNTILGVLEVPLVWK